MDTRNSYPTHLTENAWQLMHAYVAGAKPGGRPEKSPTRDMLHGIFDVVRSGCAWRQLPHDLPPEQIVYHSLWHWRKDGTWQLMYACSGVMCGWTLVSAANRTRGSSTVSRSRPRNKGSLRL